MIMMPMTPLIQKAQLMLGNTGSLIEYIGQLLCPAFFRSSLSFSMD